MLHLLLLRVVAGRTVSMCAKHIFYGVLDIGPK